MCLPWLPSLVSQRFQLKGVRFFVPSVQFVPPLFSEVRWHMSGSCFVFVVHPSYYRLHSLLRERGGIFGWYDPLTLHSHFFRRWRPKMVVVTSSPQPPFVKCFRSLKDYTTPLHPNKSWTYISIVFDAVLLCVDSLCFFVCYPRESFKDGDRGTRGDPVFEDV